MPHEHPAMCPVEGCTFPIFSTADGLCLEHILHPPAAPVVEPPAPPTTSATAPTRPRNPPKE